MAYATLAELKTYRGITSIDDDPLLTDLLTRAQRAIEQYTGREFETSADSTRYMDAIGEHIAGNTLHLGWFGDIYSITTVTNGDGNTIASTKYELYPKTLTDREPTIQRIVLLASQSTYWDYTTDWENAISIAGKWAYSATAPADIKQATIRLAAYYYAQKDAPIFDVTAIPGTGEMIVPVGMPQDVKMLIDRYAGRFAWV